MMLLRITVKLAQQLAKSHKNHIPENKEEMKKGVLFFCKFSG